VVVALMLGALAVVEAAAAPGLTETVLECALTVSGFAAMAVWVRRNRAGLDCRDWCACASGQVHVRVIRSHALEPRVEARGQSAPVTELEEVDGDAGLLAVQR
jgi:hypothetical protein